MVRYEKSIGVIMIELMSENRPCFSLIYSLVKMLVVDEQTSTVESNQAQLPLTFTFIFKCLIETDDDYDMRFHMYCMAKVDPISGARYACFYYFQFNFRAHALFSFLFLTYFAGEYISS